MTDPTLEFDGARICRETAVKRVELYDELPSTNDVALELAATRPAADFPLLVLAARQTGGRGRGDHRWWATAGALTFSLVLDTEAWQLVPGRPGVRSRHLRALTDKDLGKGRLASALTSWCPEFRSH